MAKRPSEVPRDTVRALNRGDRQTANLAECLAVDFAALMRAALPDAGEPAFERMADAASLGVTRRFALAGRITLEHLGPDRAAELAGHPSDTVRGWACYAIGAAPDRTTARRLKAIKPFAADHHFGVREWAWLALRPAIAADLDDAIDRLARWSNSRDQNIRRFASEATRPRGVWCAHLRELRADPARGLPILTPLRADPSKYVQDSVANWINDASKDAPAWARSLASEWLDAEPNAATERICRRALRSLPA